MVAPAAGPSRSLRSLSLASLGDCPAVRRDAPPKSSGEGGCGLPLPGSSARGEPSPAVTSFMSITTPHNGRAKRSKRPFVHVIHGPTAPAHKSPKRKPAAAAARDECDCADRSRRRRSRCRKQGLDGGTRTGRAPRHASTAPVASLARRTSVMKSELDTYVRARAVLALTARWWLPEYVSGSFTMCSAAGSLLNFS